MQWAISSWRRVQHRMPRLHRLTWPQLVRMLTRGVELDVGDKRELPLWSPATFDGRAELANVVELSCLVLDYDGGTTLDEAQARWPWPHILHTSWSHTPAAPRCRLVLPLERPVPAGTWARVWAWAVARDPRVDPQCGDASRQWFAPARRPGFEARVFDEPAHLLDVLAVDLPAPARPRRPPPVPAAAARGEARRALRDDPEARARAGVALGGRLVGAGEARRVKAVPCPSCGRPAVWWPLVPRGSGAWRCDHRSSCGAWGWIDELLEQRLSQ